MNFVTVLPQSNKSYIIYSYLKDDEAYFTNLISQINTKSEVEIKRYFNNLIPEYSENIVFNPSYWNKLSEYQKNDLISRIEGEFSNINMLDIDEMLGRKSNLEQRASYNLFRKFV